MAATSRFSWADLAEKAQRFHDIFHTATYDRDGKNLLARGFFLDIYQRGPPTSLI